VVWLGEDVVCLFVCCSHCLFTSASPHLSFSLFVVCFILFSFIFLSAFACRAQVQRPQRLAARRGHLGSVRTALAVVRCPCCSFLLFSSFFFCCCYSRLFLSKSCLWFNILVCQVRSDGSSRRLGEDGSRNNDARLFLWRRRQQRGRKSPQRPQEGRLSCCSSCVNLSLFLGHFSCSNVCFSSWSVHNQQGCEQGHQSSAVQPGAGKGVHTQGDTF
jgi:hypothetical protein